jgi:hypothetical protein
MGPACKCIAGESESKFARGNAQWVPHVSVGRIPVRPGLSLSLLVSFLNPRSSSLVAAAAPSSIPFMAARHSSLRRRSAPASCEGGAPQHSGHRREGGAPQHAAKEERPCTPVVAAKEERRPDNLLCSVRLLHHADTAATYTHPAFDRRSICAREVSSIGTNRPSLLRLRSMCCLSIASLE